MRKVIEKCPACGSEMAVSRLNCPECGTAVEGSFSLCPFCRLDPESLEFVMTFLRCRGNIREVERILGISYPTVKSRLNSVLRKLGYDVEIEEEPTVSARRREILRRLESGDIKASEAAEMLSNLRSGE